MRCEFALEHLDDAGLIERLKLIVEKNNRLTAILLAHIGEVDSRRLYLGAAYSSMHAYCVGALNLSEGSAYKRIHAARAARTYPMIFELVASGAIHLSGLTLLAPHLTAENHRDLLARASRRSKRAIEELIAAIAPKPDVPATLRKLPARAPQPALLAERPQAPNDSSAPASSLTRASETASTPASPSTAQHAAAPASGRASTPAFTFGLGAAAVAASGTAFAPASASAAQHAAAPASGSASTPAFTVGPGAAAVVASGTASAFAAKATAPPLTTFVPATAAVPASALAAAPVSVSQPRAALTNTARPSPAASAAVSPLSAERFKVQFTASRELRDKIVKAQALLRHQVPDGNLAEVFEKAIDELLERLMRKKFAATKKPAKPSTGAEERTRDVPTAEKRTRNVLATEKGTCSVPAEEKHIRDVLAAEKGTCSVQEKHIRDVFAAEKGTSNVRAAEKRTRDVPTAEKRTCHVPAADSRTRNVLAAEKGTRHVPSADGHIRHVPAADNRIRHVPAADSRIRHVPAADNRTRHVPAAEKRAVADRDDLRCTFTDANGRRCEERGFLEIHHEKPFAKGGPHERGNLRILCRAHNAYLAEQEFGADFMKRKKQLSPGKVDLPDRSSLRENSLKIAVGVVEPVKNRPFVSASEGCERSTVAGGGDR